MTNKWNWALLLGVMTLAATVTGCGSEADGQPEVKASNGASKPVVTSTLDRHVFERTAEAQGTVESRTTALVAARANGVLEKVFVDEGDSVEAGVTVLFETDSANYAHAVALAQADVAVAGKAVEEKQALLAQREADHKKAKQDLDRYTRLHKKQATTDDVLEKVQSGHDQLAALVEHAETLVALSEVQQEQAETALEIAKKNFADCRVVSPISGVVAKQLVELGEMASPGDPVFLVADVADLEVAFFLPATVYPEVVSGETNVRVRVGGEALGAFPVSYRSPTINTALRTFEAKCRVPAERADRVAPGMMADVSVLLGAHEALGVPVEAVQARRDDQVVFAIEGQKARAVVVTPGLRTNGLIEITSEALAPGATIVTQGQYALDDGDSVQLTGEVD